jgi:PKHD-type hydroxylase
MQYLLTPHSRKIPPFVWWGGAFTELELNWLQEKAKAAEKNAEVGADLNNRSVKVIDTSIRRSQIAWMINNHETAWVFERLGDVASRLNADYFGFDLTGFGEKLQLTNYEQSENGMYGWHQDYGGVVSRKLSLSLQLTDPSEYEGGNLQIMSGGEPETAKKQRGLIVAFPSYAVHQVTPVTQGSRQSLVAWISGPVFK